jgi:hypothetical protein
VPVLASALGLISVLVVPLARARGQVTAPGPARMAVPIVPLVVGRAWALGMVTVLGLPMEVVTGAQLRVVARACHRAQVRDRARGPLV